MSVHDRVLPIKVLLHDLPRDCARLVAQFLLAADRASPVQRDALMGALRHAVAARLASGIACSLPDALKNIASSEQWRLAIAGAKVGESLRAALPEVAEHLDAEGDRLASTERMLKGKRRAAELDAASAKRKLDLHLPQLVALALARRHRRLQRLVKALIIVLELLAAAGAVWTAEGLDSYDWVADIPGPRLINFALETFAAAAVVIVGGSWLVRRVQGSEARLRRAVTFAAGLGVGAALLALGALRTGSSEGVGVMGLLAVAGLGVCMAMAAEVGRRLEELDREIAALASHEAAAEREEAELSAAQALIVEVDAELDALAREQQSLARVDAKYTLAVRANVAERAQQAAEVEAEVSAALTVFDILKGEDTLDLEYAIGETWRVRSPVEQDEERDEGDDIIADGPQRRKP